MWKYDKPYRSFHYESKTVKLFKQQPFLLFMVSVFAMIIVLIVNLSLSLLVLSLYPDILKIPIVVQLSLMSLSLIALDLIGYIRTIKIQREPEKTHRAKRLYVIWILLTITHTWFIWWGLSRSFLGVGIHILWIAEIPHWICRLLVVNAVTYWGENVLFFLNRKAFDLNDCRSTNSGNYHISPTLETISSSQMLIRRKIPAYYRTIYYRDPQ